MPKLPTSTMKRALQLGQSIRPSGPLQFFRPLSIAPKQNPPCKSSPQSQSQSSEADSTTTSGAPDDPKFNRDGIKPPTTSDGTSTFRMTSDEYSKSGGDDAVAEQGVASFSASHSTDPGSQKETAGKGNIINPLEISPANPEVSRTVVEERVEGERLVKREVSKKGSPAKGKVVSDLQVGIRDAKPRGR